MTYLDRLNRLFVFWGGYVDLWVVSSWSTGVTAIAGSRDMAWMISMSMRYAFIGRPMV